MDRYIIAGILINIQHEYKLNESHSGFLQTAFVLSYTFTAPLFGYLGDRFSRKNQIIIGLVIWSISTISGSFVTRFDLFLALRCLVGVGEASYSTVAPTIISDLFQNHNLRSKILSLFYLAIPVGCGLGYITGSQLTKFFDDWRYSLRLTPILGLIAIFLVIIFMKEPKRNQSPRQSRWYCDLYQIFKNKTYVLCLGGVTCSTFVAGALAWWGPIYTRLGVQINQKEYAQDSAFMFGLVAMIAGIVGVLIGSLTSQILRLRMQSFSIDPIICATGLIASVPALVGGIYLTHYSVIFALIAGFVGQVFLNMNWAIVSDICMYVIPSYYRSSASAFQITISHLLGDAGSPYLIGLLADYYAEIHKNVGCNYFFPELSSCSFDLTENIIKYKSIQYGLYCALTINFIGSLLFYASAYFIDKNANNSNNKNQQQAL